MFKILVDLNLTEVPIIIESWNKIGTSFKINFLKTILSGTLIRLSKGLDPDQNYQIVKEFGSRSEPMFYLSLSGSKLFAKVISRQ